MTKTEFRSYSHSYARLWFLGKLVPSGPSQVRPSYRFVALATHHFVAIVHSGQMNRVLFVRSKQRWFCESSTKTLMKDTWAPELSHQEQFQRFHAFPFSSFKKKKKTMCLRQNVRRQITRRLEIFQNRSSTFNTYWNSTFLPLFGWHSWETIPACSWSLYNAGAFVSAEQDYQPC